MTGTIARRKSLMTAEEFLRVYGDAKGVELVKGKIVRLPMPSPEHGIVMLEAGVIIREYAKQHNLGWTMVGDTFIQTIKLPPSVRGADVAFLSYKKWPKKLGKPKGTLEVPPELVVEVKSLSDRWGNIQIKIGEYLNAGVQVVIVLDPETESASVHRQDELHQLIHNGDELTIPDLFPGFTVPVKRFFE